MKTLLESERPTAPGMTRGALSWGLQALTAPPLAGGLQAEAKRGEEARKMGRE